MSEIKLLPCPFCGGEAKYKKHYREDIYHGYLPVMKCESCGAIASLTDSDIGNYEEILTRKWNTRKPMQEIVEKLEEEIEKSSDRFVGGRSNGKTLQMGITYGIEKTIRIVKEVGGMNESGKM